MARIEHADLDAIAIGTVRAHLGALDGVGAVVCGPALALHSRIPSDIADLAVGVPITAPLSTVLDLDSGSQVVATPCPAGPVAATSYLGPCEGLGEAWGGFMGAVAVAGQAPGTTFVEAYVSNPAETTDRSTLRTDLVIFLA